MNKEKLNTQLEKYLIEYSYAKRVDAWECLVLGLLGGCDDQAQGADIEINNSGNPTSLTFYKGDSRETKECENLKKVN